MGTGRGQQGSWGWLLESGLACGLMLHTGVLSCGCGVQRCSSAYRVGWHARWVGDVDAAQIQFNTANHRPHQWQLQQALPCLNLCNRVNGHTVVWNAAFVRGPNRHDMHHTARTPSQVPPVVACRGAVERVLLVDLGRADWWVLSGVREVCACEVNKVTNFLA